MSKSEHSIWNAGYGCKSRTSYFTLFFKSNFQQGLGALHDYIHLIPLYQAAIYVNIMCIYSQYTLKYEQLLFRDTHWPTISLRLSGLLVKASMSDQPMCPWSVKVCHKATITPFFIILIYLSFNTMLPLPIKKLLKCIPKM